MPDKDEYLKSIPAGLARTGFLLEHEVTEAFRSAGWGVINNRFYIDDVDGKARELDLVVYQVSSNSDINVVTTLLISCKKNEEMAFTFMSRNKRDGEPNTDWNPVHYWTAQEPLQKFLETTSWRKNYVTEDTQLGSEIFNIRRDAFATQLVSQKNGSPQNDRLIFESISGLMKALDHEIQILPSRMKEKRIYIFNLLTIVDAPMVDARFSGTKITPIKIDDFKYLSRYMVRKRELAARIHFATKSKIDSLVETYTRLSEYDSNFFQAATINAYKAITSNRAVQDYFAKLLSSRFSWRINNVLRKNEQPKLQEEDIEFEYDKDRNELIIGVSPLVDEDGLRYLNGDAELKRSVRKLLKDNARYEGAFRFDVLIPF